MTHYQRYTRVRQASKSHGLHFRSVQANIKLAKYTDICEQATMQVRSIACMLFRFKR